MRDFPALTTKKTILSANITVLDVISAIKPQNSIEPRHCNYQRLLGTESSSILLSKMFLCVRCKARSEVPNLPSKLNPTYISSMENKAQSFLIMFFQVMAPCELVDTSQCFRKACYLHLQSWSDEPELRGNIYIYTVPGRKVWRKGPIWTSEAKTKPDQWEDSKQVSEVGEMKAALFKAHWMVSILWYETVSIFSSHEWEASIPYSGRSHLACSCSQDGAQSLSLPLRSGPSNTSSLPE